MTRFLTLSLIAILSFGTSAQAGEPLVGAYELRLEDVEGAISKALEAQGVAELLDTKVTNHRKPVMYRHKNPLTVEIRSLDYELRSSTWEANLFVMDGVEVMTALPLSGRYEEMAMVPITTKRYRHGQMIEAEGLREVALPASKLRHDTVLSMEDAIGLTPERMISKGRPMRKSELKKPDVIKEGALVHMRYQTPYMTISTIGEALEGGALGQMIRVRNNDSHSTVRATVLSPEEVAVGFINQTRDLKLANNNNYQE